MKKIMVVAMVAFAAIAAHSQTIRWGVSSGSISKISSGTMYLVWADTAPSWNDLSEMKSFSAATITTIGGTTVDSATYSAGTADTVVKPGDPISTMTQGMHRFYSVVISTDGKEFAYSSVSQTLVQNNTSPVTFSKIGSTFTVVDAAKDPEPTPEPTSAMLMLLGVAGLALKRKRA